MATNATRTVNQRAIELKAMGAAAALERIAQAMKAGNISVVPPVKTKNSD